MAKRQKSRQTDRSDPVWIALCHLGTDALTFDHSAAIQLLAAAVEREGSQVAFARRHGLDRSHLNQILGGKKSLNPAILKALRLRKVYAPDS
jgi:hypothetical protein